MSSFQNDHGPWKLLTYLFVVHLEPPDRLVMGSGVIRKTLQHQLVTSGPSSLLDPPIKHCEEMFVCQKRRSLQLCAFGCANGRGSSRVLSG